MRISSINVAVSIDVHCHWHGKTSTTGGWTLARSHFLHSTGVAQGHHGTSTDMTSTHKNNPWLIYHRKTIGKW